jgi:hypothetical protein
VCGGSRWYTPRSSWRKSGSSRLTDEFHEVRDGLIEFRFRFRPQDVHLSVREELTGSLVAYNHFREEFRHASRFPLTAMPSRCLASFRGLTSYQHSRPKLRRFHFADKFLLYQYRCDGPHCIFNPLRTPSFYADDEALGEGEEGDLSYPLSYAVSP